MNDCEDCGKIAEFSISEPIETCIGFMSENHRYCGNCVLNHVVEDHYVEVIKLQTSIGDDQ